MATSGQSGSTSLRAFYLAYFFAIGGSSPFAALYYQSIHLNGAQIGLIASLTPLAGLLLPPFLGVLSDRKGWRRGLLFVSLISTGIWACAVPLNHTFLWVLGLLLLLSICGSPAVPLANAAALEWLARHGGSFGSVRVFGSLGYLIASLSMGFILSGGHLTWLYLIFGAVMGITALLSLLLPRQEQLVRQDTGSGIREVLGDKVIATFLLWSAVALAAWAPYNTFFPLYMKGLGAGTSLVGVAIGLATLSELPAMALTGVIMRRVGIKPMILISLAVSTARWLAYGLFHDYRLVLILQPLHGVAYAFFYIAGVTLVDQRLPTHLRATGQSLFNAAAYGLGAVVGSNLFGVLFDRIGGAGIFLLASGISGVALVAMLITTPAARVDAGVHPPTPEHRQ